MRRALALLTALAVVVLVPGPASAGPRTTVDDPDDVISTIDLKRVQLEAKGPRIIARFSTYDVFTREDLNGANGIHLRFQLKNRWYREVLVWWVGDKLTSTICSGRIDDPPIDRKCSVLKAKRTGDRSLRVAIPRKLIDKGARTYRWNAWSDVWIQSAGCDGSGPCDDYIAPEGTYLRWRAPRA